MYSSNGEGREGKNVGEVNATFLQFLSMHDSLSITHLFIWSMSRTAKALTFSLLSP